MRSLLDELSQQMGCSYLSDLHDCVAYKSKQLKDEIKAIPAERYSLREWQDTATYLGLTGEAYRTPEEARNAILNS